MEQDGDWVKEHRSVMDHPVFQDDWLYRLFRWCIMKAAYKPARFRGHQIKVGQFVTGRSVGAEELGVSQSKFYRGIQRLTEAPYECILIEANRDFSIVSVCNYRRYQQGSVSERAPSERRASAERAPSERRTNTIEEDKNLRNKEDRNPLPPSAKQTRRKSDRDYSSEFLEFWDLFPPVRKGSKPLAWEAWQSAVTRKPAEAILAAAKDFAASQLASTKFCPGPAPWLNQDRWDDDHASWQDHNAKAEPPMAEPLTPDQFSSWNSVDGGAP